MFYCVGCSKNEGMVVFCELMKINLHLQLKIKLYVHPLFLYPAVRYKFAVIMHWCIYVCGM